jgi:hypothetical protein
MAKQSREVTHDVGAIVSFPADMVLETTIAGRDPDGRTLQFALGDMPQAAVEKMLRYGAQRIFNDATGGSQTTAADKVAAAEAMIERFKRGEIGRVAAAGVDAVTKLARSKVRAALRKTNPPAYSRLKELDAAEAAEKLDAILERNPKFREDAEAEVRAAQAAVVTIDTEGVEL